MPEVDQDGDTDGEEREQANHLAAQSAGEEGTSCKQPTPPFRRELTARPSDVRTTLSKNSGGHSLIAKFPELDVCKE